MTFPQYIPQNYAILISNIYLKGNCMNNFINQKINNWSILSNEGRDYKSNQLVLCKCDCGLEKIHRLSTVLSGKSIKCKSCHMKDLNKVDDVINKKFGKWFVLQQVETKNGNLRYLCQCECGRKVEVDGYRLRKGHSKSCPNCRVKTHGSSYTPTFKIWSDLFSRCYNSNHKSFHRYGGRGFIVCERWHKFENFLVDMGERPNGLQIDRTNNDGIYEPGNCRWVTAKENFANRNIAKKKEN